MALYGVPKTDFSAGIKPKKPKTPPAAPVARNDTVSPAVEPAERGGGGEVRGGGGGGGTVGIWGGGGGGGGGGGLPKPSRGNVDNYASQQQEGPDRIGRGANIDIASQLSGLFNSAPGGGGGTVGINPPIENTAGTDPNLQDYLDRIKKRLDDPEGGKHAIDVAGSAIRDLGEGEKAALHAGAARRGVLSSSTIPQIGEAAISENVQSRVAKAASDIALGRERDKDAILTGAGGAFGAIGGAQRADRALALQQWQAGEAARRAAEQANMQQWLGSLDLIGNLLRL